MSEFNATNPPIRFDEEQRIVLQGKVTFCDADGRPYCVLNSDSDGGYLHLLDENGRMTVSMGSSGNGGFVDVHFANKTRLAVTICTAGNEGLIEVFDAQGNMTFTLPLNGDEKETGL